MHKGRKHRRRTRKMRGGRANTLSPNNYETVTSNGGSSGWSYVNNIVGNLDQQYNKALMGNGSGNQLMSGGRRRRYKRSRRNRRGGSFASAVNTAIVPLGLLAAQQMYKSRKLRKSRKH